VGGLGNQIQVALRRSDLESIYLILITIPIVALFVDRMLYWMQRELFPHVYGGDGYLHQLARFLAHRWDDLKYTVFGGATAPESVPHAASPVEQQPK
jgi:hypothetical protein